MEENKISKGKEILAILLLTMVIATGTLAWIVWSSKDNTKMNVTIGDLADVSFKTGNDINISNLSPSFYYDDGALTEFSVRKKKGLTTELNTSIYLDITSISNELKNDNFKYVLLSSSDGNTYNEVISSSFKDASIGKLSIVTDTPLTDGKTYYKFYIWIDGNNENNETMQGKSMKASLNVKVATPTANFVEELDDETTGDSGSGVYKVHHDAIPADSSATGEEIPAVDDYRYYGPSPNNYICLDMESQNTCPDRSLFRIIGSIYEENAGKNLLKVIKATPLTDGTVSKFSWDYKYDATYLNIWTSTPNDISDGSTIMQLLNSIYLTRGTSNYYNGMTTATSVNFTSYGLTDKSQKNINQKSKYYLGEYSTERQQPSITYIDERGKLTSNTKSLYWDGVVGLLYPSDYGYASGFICATKTNMEDYNGTCSNKGWIYNSNYWQWTITSTTYNTKRVSVITAQGHIANNTVNIQYSIHPVFYLKSDITLIGGTGTKTDPYLVQ